MSDVAVAGVSMTKFGKFLDRGLKDLSAEAVNGALHSANIDKSRLQAAVVGNSVAGLITGQEMIRGQVVLRDIGIGGIPVVNTENACASSSTAFHLACLYVASGMYDVVLALGMEKLYHADKKVSFRAIGSAVDMEADGSAQFAGEGAGERRSIFMDFYAGIAERHMKKYGITVEQLAQIAVKNHYHGSLNPHAQYREVYSLEDVLTSPRIAGPLTRLMCSPIGDGAAAAIVTSADLARQLTTKPVYVKASALASGWDHAEGEPGVTKRVVQQAYEMAGVQASDLSVIECHDAAAPGELVLYEDLGLCGEGEAGALIDSRATYLGGLIPVNPSGGLISKGHPIGATGVAQIYELFSQLRGEAGERQVQGAKVGLAENIGGMVRGDFAAACVHILTV